MDFGRDPALALDEVDFVLPQLEPRSVAALAASTPILTTPLRVGAPAWAVPAWVGDLYPRGASRADWLKHYAARFDTVELNATFYAIPTRARCAAWAEAVRENTAFRFCPKAPRALSHAPGFRPAAADVRAFVHAVEGFGEHLGPSLLQLHEAVGPSRLPEIVRLLDALPRALPLALEVRHPGFFAERRLAAPLFEALASRAVGAVVTDVAGRRDVCHVSLPTPTLFVRLVCNGLHPTDAVRARAWSARLLELRARGLRESHLFVHQPDDADALSTLATLQQALGRPASPPPPAGQLTLL